MECQGPGEGAEHRETDIGEVFASTEGTPRYASHWSVRMKQSTHCGTVYRVSACGIELDAEQ